MKVLKDNIFNKILLIKSDSDNSSQSFENFTPICDIVKEDDKYYFMPLRNELGTDRETTKEVSWLIYNKKANPKINSEYYLTEGDIMKLGNAVFIIKMIQINNLGNSKIVNNNNDENDTIMLNGSYNNSIIINEHNNLDNIETLKTQKITVFASNKEKSEEKIINKIKEEKIKNKICRICYQEEDDPLINPLIKPCKCSGSMKYIHLKCLLFWLKSKTVHSNNSIDNNNFFKSYFIEDSVQCELCKEIFPDFIKHNHIKYCLIDFDYSQENQIKKNNIISAQNFINTSHDIENNKSNIPKENDTSNEDISNFIILDTIFPLNDGNKHRCIVKFNKDNQILIGRGLENQLVLNEITVSRTHCLLTAQRNKFGKKELKLEDFESKFGTLVLLQSNKYEIIKGKPLHVQIGNVHLVLTIPIKKSFFSCCNVDVIDGKNSYERINRRAIKIKYNANILSEKTDDDIDKETDNNNGIINNIHLKSTEINNNIKPINNIDINGNIYELKENVDINNKEKNEDNKDEDNKDEDNKDEDKKEEEVKTKIIKDYMDNDFEKKSFILSTKRKNIIGNINKEIKYIQTSPETNSKNLLEPKSIKILKNIHAKKEKSKKDSESVVIVEDESEKN